MIFFLVIVESTLKSYDVNSENVVSSVGVEVLALVKKVKKEIRCLNYCLNVANLLIIHHRHPNTATAS